MTYYAKPITSRDDAVGVTTWLWAANDGLHCGDNPPESKVPTGHLWGWGSDVKVHLREDAVAPTRGVLLTDRQAAGLVEAEVLAVGKKGYPKTVLGQDRFLRCASDEDLDRFSDLKLDVTVLLQPTNVVLVGDANVVSFK